MAKRKLSNDPDICDCGILRKNCQICPQNPAELTAWQKALEIQKAQKFLIRNYVVEHMGTICAWDLYHDVQTGKDISGTSVFVVLLAMAKYAWSDPATVFPGNTALAKSTGLSVNYVANVKRVLADLDIITRDWTGKSKKHTDRFIMRLDKIKKFVEYAEVRVSRPDIPTAMDGFVPNFKAHDAEELAMFAAEDDESADVSTEDKNYISAADSLPDCIHSEIDRNEQGEEDTPTLNGE